MSIASRWPTLIRVAVGAEDLDADERLTEAAIERAFADARAKYFERCRTFDGPAAGMSGLAVARGDAKPGDHVTVSVAVIEVFPERFTMAGRIRPAEGDEIVADLRCTVAPAGGVSDEIRDELIAHAHEARYAH
jgi:acyl-CoA thioesterase FadM